MDDLNSGVYFLVGIIKTPILDYLGFYPRNKVVRIFSIRANADLLNSSNGHLVTAFSKNKQIFQSVFFSDADLDISSYSKAKKLYKSDLEQFIGLNNSNKMHGVNHAGNGNGAMDETVSKYRYKVSGRNTIIISGEVNNGDDNTWKQQIIKLTDIRENKNGSWSLIASRPDESNKIVKTSLILFPQTVE